VVAIVCPPESIPVLFPLILSWCGPPPPLSLSLPFFFFCELPISSSLPSNCGRDYSRVSPRATAPPFCPALCYSFTGRLPSPPHSSRPTHGDSPNQSQIPDHRSPPRYFPRNERWTALPRERFFVSYSLPLRNHLRRMRVFTIFREFPTLFSPPSAQAVETAFRSAVSQGAYLCFRFSPPWLGILGVNNVIKTPSLKAIPF